MNTLLLHSLPADPFFTVLFFMLGSVIVFSLIFALYFIVWSLPKQPLVRLHRIAANGKKAPVIVGGVIVADLMWWVVELLYPIRSPFNWVVVMAGVDAWFFCYVLILVFGARRARKCISAIESHGRPTI